MVFVRLKLSFENRLTVAVVESIDEVQVIAGDYSRPSCPEIIRSFWNEWEVS